MPILLAIASLALVAASAHIALNIPTAPPIVATVDLERLFNSLPEQTSESERLDAIAGEFDEQVAALRDDVENLQAELENFQEGGDTWVATSRKVAGAISEYRAVEKYARLKMEAERSKSMRSIYDRIRESVAAFAASQSPPIDIVLIDDSIPEFEPSDTAGTQRQISARRVLYVNNAFDITDALLASMNGTAGG
jgi:Skp family chaperone for outer membrane proteins